MNRVELTPSFEVEEHAEGRVVVFRVTQAPTREMVDAWERYLREVYFPRMGAGNQRNLIYDCTRVNFLAFTPYWRTRMAAMAVEDCNAVGRCGIVLKMMGPMRFAIDQFLRQVATKDQPGIENRIMKSVEEAMDWVTEPVHEG